jgi:glycosyltransferase involved in cell wall biosynthesis
MPTVDVAIPNYNYGRYLRGCVESVLSQKCVTRVLIIDNASTDNSVEEAQELAEMDARITIVARKENLGPHSSWNEAIDWATGDYFTVLCSDDLLTTDALLRATSIMEQCPNVHVSLGACAHSLSNVVQLPSSQDQVRWRIWEGRAFVKRLINRHVNVASFVVRTTAQKAAGYYRPELAFTDDLEMLLRLACLGDVAETQTHQFVQRLHDSNISQALWKDPIARLAESAAAFESFFSHEGRSLAGSESLRSLARRSIGKAAYWSAVSHLCRFRTDDAVRLLQLALAYNQNVLLLPPVDYLFHVDEPHRRVANAFTGMVKYLGRRV